MPNTLNALESLPTAAAVQSLNDLGLYTVADLAGFAPLVQAQLLVELAARGDADQLGWARQAYLRQDGGEPLALADAPLAALRVLSGSQAASLEQALGIGNLGQAAVWPPFLEARRHVQSCADEAFCEPPSAPGWLLPEPLGSTHSTVRFSNYIRDREFRFPRLGLVRNDDLQQPRPNAELLEAFVAPAFHGWLGYLGGIKQHWVNAGTHLGEIVHSVALAPGESRNLAFVSWQARQASRRDEDSTASEQLSNRLQQTRAVNEVVEVTAREHLFGETEIDATTKTTGFGATTGLGSTTGASSASSANAQMDLTSIVGIPLGVGGEGSNAVTSGLAGGIGASLVTSKGSTQGTIYSETSGEREVFGEVTQNISDSTVQNAANVRGLMSTVVVEDEQTGNQSGQTQNITNYNHSHALTVQHYEVLQKYLVTTGPHSIKPMLFLPFRPMSFNFETIRRYWHLLGPALKASLPARFALWDQVVRDFSPVNGAFDKDGELKITRVRLVRNRARYDDSVYVELNDANPVVRFRIARSRLRDAFELSLQGLQTYFSYKPIRTAEHTAQSFAGQPQIDADETLSFAFASSFNRLLKSALRAAIDGADTAPVNRIMNPAEGEVSPTNDRELLKDDVSNDRFNITNGSSNLRVDLNAELTLRDVNGQTEIVRVPVRRSFTYDSLNGGNLDSRSVAASPAIQEFLDAIADINPSGDIDDIIEYFQFRRYGLTRALLEATEPQQLVDLIEHLGIGSAKQSVPLARFVDPEPLAITAHHLIFALKDRRPRRRVAQEAGGGEREAAALHPEVTSGRHQDYELIIRRARSTRGLAAIRGKGVWWDRNTTHPSFRLTGALTLLREDRGLSANFSFRLEEGKPGEAYRPLSGEVIFERNGKSRRFGDLAGQARWKSEGVLELRMQFPEPESPEERFNAVMVLQRDEAKPAPVEPEPPPQIDQDTDAPNAPQELLGGYLDELDEYLEAARQQRRTESVFLPTPGVFGEAVLGRSNASEKLDVTRFFNWQDSPIPNTAPALSALDLNVDRTAEVPTSALDPALSSVTLTPQASQNWGLPGGLGQALSAVQNGAMFNDMSKSGQLATVAGQLATMATEIGKLAGSLSGEALANALASATEVAKASAALAGQAAAASPAPPPLTPTDRGLAQRTLEQIDNDPAPNRGGMSPTDDARLQTVGLDDPSRFPGTGGGGGGSGGGSNGGAPGAGDGETPPGDGATDTDSAYGDGPCQYRNEQEIRDSFARPMIAAHEPVPSVAPWGTEAGINWGHNRYLIANFGVGSSLFDFDNDRVMAIDEAFHVEVIQLMGEFRYSQQADTWYAMHLDFVGYSDCVGNESRNGALRRARAQAVRAAYLEAMQNWASTDGWSAASVAPRLSEARAADPDTDLMENVDDHAERRTFNRGVRIVPRWQAIAVDMVPEVLRNDPSGGDQVRHSNGRTFILEHEEDIQVAIEALPGLSEQQKSQATCVLSLRNDVYLDAAGMRAYLDAAASADQSLPPESLAALKRPIDDLAFYAHQHPEASKVAQRCAHVAEDIRAGLTEIDVLAAAYPEAQDDVDVLRLWVASSDLYGCFQLAEAQVNP